MTLLYNATIVTAEKEGKGAILIDGDSISKVYWEDQHQVPEITEDAIDLQGKYIIAGGIDAHVHFREPGLTHKADMQTESRAAVAGGVTTVFDMPNTSPATISAEALAGKMQLAKRRSLAKIGFHIGASNSNADQICSLVKDGDPATGLKASDIPGVKVFMGSSTGNMLVDDRNSLERLFRIKEKPVLVHCEDEAMIRANLAAATEKYGDDIPFDQHPAIRSRQACIRSSIKALELAMTHGTKLVLCHISTREEMEMVRAAKQTNPEIIAETSCNYLWFSDEDYQRLGSGVKCNPAVKTAADRQALRDGLANGLIDTIGSDHAPHLLSEKDAPYAKAPSGLPSIQQSLPVLLTVAKQEDIPLTRIAAVFSENASKLYLLDTGRIAPGMKADLVIFDFDKEFTVKAEDQYSKCGWTPYEGESLNGWIETVYVNGQKVLDNGRIN
ncbi:MAG: amidohydrolase family protein [Clostridia bacterium]|nr:amidohydrolase family protein [Clostridia bacterium]